MAFIPKWEHGNEIQDFSKTHFAEQRGVARLHPTTNAGDDLHELHGFGKRRGGLFGQLAGTAVAVDHAEHGRADIVGIRHKWLHDESFSRQIGRIQGQSSQRS
jgi:hypothetical protein